MEATQSGSVVVVVVLVVVDAGVVGVESGKVLQMKVVELVVVVNVGWLPQRVRQGAPALQLLEEGWKVSPCEQEWWFASWAGPSPEHI